MKEELYIRRSIPECMGMAWTLLTTNLRRMATALWFPAVVLAVLCSIETVINNIFPMQLYTGDSINVTYLLWLFGSTLFLVLAGLFLDAKIYKLLNLQTLAFCWQRVTIVFAISLLLCIIGMAIIVGCAMMDTYLAMTGKIATTTAVVLFVVEFLVALVLMLVFFSPMMFALLKYMVEPTTVVKMTWKNYRMGLRHIGFIVGFCLLCFIVLVIIFAIVALPMVITTIASALSAQGVALGDPSGLPALFPLLFTLTTFFTTFIAVILRIWSIFAAYYVYASIEAKNGRTDEEGEGDAMP